MVDRVSTCQHRVDDAYQFVIDVDRSHSDLILLNTIYIYIYIYTAKWRVAHATHKKNT